MSSDSVRKLFPQVFANGYVPLPNRDKECRLPKWPTIDVTEEQCRLWTRQTRWPAIGLRMEPPLLVLDFDLPDDGIMKAVEGITPSIVFDGLERQGSPPKTAFFLRLHDDDELFYQLSTRRYLFQGQTKPGYRLEAFGSGGLGKQFGAFGPHSHDEHGAVLKTYQWIGGRSPATVPLSDLPVMRRAEVAALLDEVDALLASWPGLVLDEQARASGDGYLQVYDLTDDMVFVDSDGSEYTLEELTAEAKARKELGQPELRITGSFTNDPLSSGSPRCKAHWSKIGGPNGSVSVTDHKTGKTHHPFDQKPDEMVHDLFNQIFKA